MNRRVYRKVRHRAVISPVRKFYWSWIFIFFVVFGFLGLVGYYMVSQQRFLAGVGIISPVAPDDSHVTFLQSIGSRSVVSDGENSLQREQPSIDEVVFHGLRDKHVVALTFDADMTPGMEEELRSGRVRSYYDPRIIDFLTRTQTKATLFLSGMWIEMYPEVTKQLAANPLFELSNHSYSHPSFSGTCYGLRQISADSDAEEIEKTQELLKQVAHVENTFFRFPGGCYSQENVEIVRKAGLRVIDWDVVGSDAFNNNAGIISQNVLNRVQNGSIVVLHMMGPPNAPRTAEALPEIVATLRERGYVFVTVSELLDYQKVSKAFDYRDYLW